MSDEAAPVMVIPLETLDVPALINYIKDLEASLKNVQFDYMLLKEQYDLLVYKRFGRSAEKLLEDKKQQLLFGPEEVTGEAAVQPKAEELTEVKPFMRKKAGRKPIAPDIPRRERIIDIGEEEKTCACGAKLTRIGEETSEKLHIEPPVIYVEKIIRPKYACRSCEGTEDEDTPTVRIAPVEPAIIPKSIASASLLSTIIIQKFEDHLPYYRQEIQFARIGVQLSRQDMSNWQQQAYGKIKPLFGLLKGVLRSGPVMKMDETPVQVMGEEGREDTGESRMWLALGGPPGKPVVLYEYHETRGAKHAQEILTGFRGYLQTDGYIGYDAAVEGNAAIVQVGCFAHVRRKFFEAVKVSEQKTLAEEAIGYIKKLYSIEAELRKKHEEDGNDSAEKAEGKQELFRSERKESTGPVFEGFKAWLAEWVVKVPPKTMVGQAIGYSLSQWEKLIKYVESPYLTPDNNACENAIRPFVIGRKNWLFSKSPEGAESSCGMYTLIQTAKLNGLVPIRYLTALFEKAPYASSREDWVKLLPWNIFKNS